MTSSRSTKGAIFRDLLEVKRPNKPFSSNGTIKKTHSNISLKNDSSDSFNLHNEKNKSKIPNRSVLNIQKYESRNDRKEKERYIKHTSSDSMKYQQEKRGSVPFKRQFSLPSTKQEKSKKYREKPGTSVKKKDEIQEQSYKFYVNDNIKVNVNLIIDNTINPIVNEPRVINIVKNDVDRTSLERHRSNETINVTNLIDFEDTNTNLLNDMVDDNWLDQNDENDNEYTEVVQTFNYQHQYLKYLRLYLRNIEKAINDAALLLDQDNIKEERIEGLMKRFHNLSEMCFKDEVNELYTALNDDGNIVEICEIQINKVDEHEYDKNDINVINSELIIRRSDHITEYEDIKEKNFSQYGNTSSNALSAFSGTTNDQILELKNLSKRESLKSCVNPEPESKPADYELDRNSNIGTNQVNQDSEIAISCKDEESKISTFIGADKLETINRNRQLQFIMNELQETEIKYVNDLGKVVNKFKPFMLKEATNHRDKIRYLFSNIDKIYTGAQIFLNDLKICHDALEIAELFIKHEKYFAMYEKYLRNKPKYDYNLKYFEKEIKALMVKFNEKLNLASYLMIPFQRLGKYILMLEKMDEELLKLNEESGPIKEAAGIVRQVLSNGNTAVAIDSINGCPLKGTHWGAFIMRDEFTCIKPKRNEMVLFLFEHVVVLTTANSKLKERFDHIESILLNEMTFSSLEGNVIELGNYGKRKKVVDNKMSYKLEAKTEKIFQKWTSEIEDRLWSQMNLVKEIASKTLKMRSNQKHLQNNVESNSSSYNHIYSSGVREGRTTFYSPMLTT